MKNILHIDASARSSSSTTRNFSKRIVDALSGSDNINVTRRNAGAELPLLNESMVEAYFTPEDDRSAAHLEAIRESDAITQELLQADLLVIGVPIYNFSAPAAFKAWCDLAARAKVTFEYTETGPRGLLNNKQAIIVVNSGGTPIGSEIDFLTPWLRHYLAFLGISDTRVITVSDLERDFDAIAADLINHAESIAA